jgi:putative transposase
MAPTNACTAPSKPAPAGRHAGRPAAGLQRFRTLYNNERPHEYLGGRTPSSCYTASPRPFPDHLPPLEYPGHFLVKRVTNAGTFRLKHKLLFLANALKQHHIGLDETDDGIWSIYFGTVLLGRVDERDMIIRD